MKRFISLAEYINLANKYDGADFEVIVGVDDNNENVTETVPYWMSTFVELYKTFNQYNRNAYDNTKHLYTGFNSLRAFVVDALITRFANLSIGVEFTEGYCHVFTADYVIPNYSFIDNVSEEAAYRMMEGFIRNQIGYWVSVNKYDAIRAISAMQLDYNPIENYNMIEHNFGNHERTKEYNANDVNQITVTAPLTNVSVSKDQEGKYNFDALTPTADKSLSETSNGSTSNTGSTEAPTDVTTFESEDYKHANKNTTSSTDSSTINNTTSRDVTASAEFKLGNSEAGYTETESYNGYGMDRSGNIGVTTTQQMIEQEIQLRTKQLINNYISDCNKKWLLSVWN